MKKVYVVFGDYGVFIDKIFETEEKARHYIKNNRIAIEDFEELQDDFLGDFTWEDYFNRKKVVGYFTYEEFDLE